MSNYILWFIHAILESLPISSSGHLRLIKYLINDKNYSSSNIDFLMHIPTAIVLFIFLWINKSSILPNFDNIFYLDIYNPKFIKLLGLIFIADAITVLFYGLFHFIDINKFPLYLGFIITSLLLLVTGVIKPGYNQEISYMQAAMIGLAQSLALLPGISRMAITYTTGYFLGISALNSLLFSCLIEFPLVIVAILKAIFYIKYNNKNAGEFEINFDINFVFMLFASILLAYLSLYFVVFLASNNYLWYLGIYMILPIILSFFMYKYVALKYL